jgi:inward rectifier potassium channel
MLSFNRQPRQPRKIRSDQTKELGFGRQVTTGRLMNADGSFNVERQALSSWDNTYHHLITMPWGWFFGGFLGVFVLLNAFFATVYWLIGVEHLNGIKLGSPLEEWLQAYFFSSQTLTTVGYGHISPVGLLTNIVASLESFAGLLAFALISGLLYGRFSRPRAKVVFSPQMLVAPYRGGQGLMFRMGNASRSELIETEAQVLVAYNQADDKGNVQRSFSPLALEISKISFFSLSWTVVHPLDDKSPLYGLSREDILEANTELMVLVKATEDTNQQNVHARHSYTGEDIVWGARFAPITARNRKGQPHVLLSRIGQYDKAED